MDTVKIGRYISKKRKEKGLTQKQLGDKLGVTNKTISRWENGNYMPDLSLLEPLSKELGISLNELLAGGDLNTEIVTAEKLAEQAEKSLTDTLQYSRQELQKNKKKYLLGGLAGLVAFLVILFILFDQTYFKEVPSYYNYEKTIQYQKEFPEVSAYGLNISYSDKPVFRNRSAALGRAKMDYEEAIKAIKKECNIVLPLSKYTCEAYKEGTTYFLTVAEDTALITQAKALLRVLEVYGNSFDWKDMHYNLQQQIVEYEQIQTVNLAEQQRKAVITALILFTFGIIFVIYGVCDIYKDKQKEKLVCETKGTITGLLKSHLFRNDIYGEIPGGVQIGWGVAQGEQFWGGSLKWRIPPWFPCVKYYVGDKEYWRLMGDGNLKDAWYIGQEVTILYNEKNPRKSEIQGDESIKFKMKIDFLVAAVFLAAGMLAIMLMR